MTQPAPQPTTFDCILENILGFMLPFFLASAGGNADIARAAIRHMIEPFNPKTPTELELVGRILGFGIVSMDNLRLSMTLGMSDTKVLRYRSNAVSLSRAADQCRKILEALQGTGKPAAKPKPVPQPVIAAAPPSPVVKTQPPQFAKADMRPQYREPPMDLEAMKRDARTMLSVFANTGRAPGQSVAIPQIRDPAALVGAAVRDAMAASKRATAL